MKHRLLSILACAVVAIALAACGGGSGDQQASSSPSAAATSAPTPTPNPASAIDVTLVSATITGAPTPENQVPVLVTYNVKVAAQNGIASAYGEAGLPLATQCDHGNAVSIELSSPLPSGATVQRSATFYCSAASAKDLAGYPQNFYSMSFTPSAITYP